MTVRRRGFLAGCLCCAGAAAARAATTDFAEIVPGLFLRRGLDADAATGNDDAIANIGFVVGRDAAAVIDPGGSLADGRLLRAALRRATDKPIRYVVLSHVHPDHVFGAGAFRDDSPAFVGHARLPAALAARGTFYRQFLERALGPGASGPVVMPDRLVQDTLDLDLGGRVLTLTAHPPAHTDSDLSLFDHASGTLLTTDLLFAHRLPSLDGSLLGWLAALPALRAVPARRVIPGHGPLDIDAGRAFADLERYLTALRDGVRAAIAKGVPMQDTAAHVAQNERSRWALWDDYHGRNVIEAYQELQWE